ncbi:unnamed protein product [Ambrosiozyma monospora]|uniref:Unnamed protein product n=1 Tax=Ambrosiozyma monospora TaxID=43982 RepID=A0ACB5T3B7_AMBMO|nr:unnamed protein product [Ambrosiozyma monospora]
MVSHQQALDKVRDLIKSEDDLLKLDAIKEGLQKEKETVSSQLKLEEQRRVDQIAKLVANLQSSNKNYSDLRQSVYKLNNLASSNELIDKNLNSSAAVLKNFQEVQAIYDMFLNLSKKYQLIDQLISLEMKQGEISETSSGDNMLMIHYELTKLHDFKDELTVWANKSTNDVQLTVSSQMEPLEGLITKFETIIKLVIESFPEIIDCANYGLLIKLVKIIQVEEREDMKMQLLEKVSAGRSNANMSTNKIKRASPRNYRSKFETYFKKHIESAFDMLKSENYATALDLVKENYYDTLQIYKHGVDQCFPPSWNFFKSKVLKWYQGALSSFINAILDDESITNEFIATLIQFDYENRQQLKQLFGLKKAELDSVALLPAEQKTKLLNDALEFNTNTTTTLINNALKPVFEIFKERTKEPPEYKDGGMLGVETAQNIMGIFQASITYLSDLGDSTLLCSYIRNFSYEIMHDYHDKWVEVLNTESSKWNADSQDPTIGLLPRYITIVANDCVKFADALEMKCEDIKKLVHVSFHDGLSESFGAAAQFELDLGQTCLQKLNYFMEVEYQPLLTNVFTKQWYNSDQDISEAMRIMDESYLSPYQEYLNEELFIALFEVALDKFLFNYVDKLKQKKAVFEKKKFEAKMDRDGQLFNETFSKFDSVGIFSVHAFILDLIIDVLNHCEDEQDYIDKWDGAVAAFNDIPLSFMKLLLDFKKIKDSKARFILDECETIKADPVEPSFMGDFVYDN